MKKNIWGQPEHPLDLIRVFSVRLKGCQGLKLTPRLIRLGGCLGFSEPSLGAHVTLSLFIYNFVTYVLNPHLSGVIVHLYHLDESFCVLGISDECFHFHNILHGSY